MSNPILVTCIKMQPQNIQYPVVKMQPHPAAHTHLPTTGKSPPPHSRWIKHLFSQTTCQMTMFSVFYLKVQTFAQQLISFSQ